MVTRDTQTARLARINALLRKLKDETDAFGARLPNSARNDADLETGTPARAKGPAASRRPGAGAAIHKTHPIPPPDTVARGQK